LIILPQWIGLILLLIFQPIFLQYSEKIPLWAWVILILFIDVSHVYSTLFRTYFDVNSWKANTNTLLLIPFSGLLIGIFLYSIDGLIYWRFLAYLAVFHFIRQQYGFIRLYSRQSKEPAWNLKTDQRMVYAFTIIPILIWHFSGPKNFNWFVENDFIYIQNQWFKIGLQIVWYVLFVSYIVKEIWIFKHYKEWSLPRFLFMLGTAFSWFIGIVVCNGDLAFTTLNVVSHGIPYIALVWFFGVKNYQNKPSTPVLSKIFSIKYVAVFITVLILFAYLEEGLWDGLIWRENAFIFGIFYQFPRIDETWLSFIIPLLALPQWTHYVLDGFIWKIGNQNFYWKKF